MTDPGVAHRVSVVVASRHRPDALLRCLTSLSQLYGPPPEVIVVADPASCTALSAWLCKIKVIAFDDANISAARNLGIAQAAGEIVAFLDDDAVAEPTWLSRLVAPLVDGRAEAAGGTVLGRNGFSPQWKPEEIQRDGSSVVLADADTGSEQIWTGRAIKTQGTNMAFRRDLLARLGGFDPGYRFYLDEADLDMRLAAEGARIALVPDAVVHHGFEASDRRRADRAPLSIEEIGASLAYFLRRHALPSDHESAMRRARAEQRRRLLSHMVAGRIEPPNVNVLLAGFDRGVQTGMARPLAPPDTIGASPSPYLPLPMFTGEHVILSGRRRHRAALSQRAEALVRKGHRVSVYEFSITALYHRRQFLPFGYWRQTGGLFGRSLRTDPLFRYWRFADRVQREAELVFKLREA